MNWKRSIMTGVKSATLTLAILFMVFLLLSMGVSLIDAFWRWLLYLPIALIIGSIAGISLQWFQNGIKPVFIIILSTFGILMGAILAILLGNPYLNQYYIKKDYILIVLTGGVASELLVILIIIAIRKLWNYLCTLVNRR